MLAVLCCMHVLSLCCLIFLFSWYCDDAMTAFTDHEHPSTKNHLSCYLFFFGNDNYDDNDDYSILIFLIDSPIIFFLSLFFDSSSSENVIRKCHQKMSHWIIEKEKKPKRIINWLMSMCWLAMHRIRRSHIIFFNCRVAYIKLIYIGNYTGDFGARWTIRSCIGAFSNK